MYDLAGFSWLRKDASAAVELAATKSEFRYGWVIVACAFVVLCIAYGIQFTFGIFMPFISAETGWDSGSLSLPYSVYVFVYCALSLISGRLTDRLGPRVVLTAGGCLLGTGIMLMSQVRALWHI